MNEAETARCGRVIPLSEYQAEAAHQAQLWRDAVDLFAEGFRIAKENARRRARRRSAGLASAVLFGSSDQ